MRMIGASMSRFRRRLGKIDSAHGRHLVVDHKTVGFARRDPIQQCRAAPKRPNGEPVRLKEKSQ